MSRLFVPAVLVVLLIISPVMVATAAPPGSGPILVIVYNYGYSTDPNTFNLANNLVGLGYSVTILYRPAPGVIASTLAGTAFEQVYLWDVTTTLGLTDSGDLNALVNWYSGVRGNIVIDGRSYGLYFDIARDAKLLENIAYAFYLSSGGLWIGTDHSSWAQNGNALLSALGYGTLTGSYGTAPADGDTASVLLTTPNIIVPNTLWGVASVSQAPTGVQPDNVNLLPLLWNSVGVTYTSYALTAIVPTGFIDVDYDPDYGCGLSDSDKDPDCDVDIDAH